MSLERWRRHCIAEVGCAVQSRYFAIGAVTPWVRAGVGAVATQAMGVVARNGERALDALARDVDPAVALDQVLADDADRELRQLGAVAADGRAAAFTGRSCVQWAGHLVEQGFAVQGNMLASADVLPAMQRTFVETAAPLPERMMAALEAGQAAGATAGGSRRLRLSSSSSAQRRAPEKASIAHAIFASTTIPNRSSNCTACSPSGGNGKPNARFELIPLAWASVLTPEARPL
jgi:uncharacterized Ntn-hydrolase superfamily protein